MGKHTIWIFALLLFAFSGDRICGYILQKITEKSQFRYSRLYNGQEDADILFVGNSRGLTFFQPEVETLTSLKTINLSYNGMPADLAKCLVLDYLDRHKTPKIMVVDVTMCDRENDLLKTGFNLYTPQSVRLDTLLRGIKTPDSWAGRKVVYGGNVSWLYRHNSEIFQRVLYYRQKSDKDWLLDRTIGEDAANDPNLKSYQVRMYPNMVEHLKEMVNYAQNKGIQVKLVINPYYPPFAETIRDSFLTPLKQHVEMQTGMAVDDFSTILKERGEIGDFQHANKNGSTHFMKILMAKGYFSTTNSAIGIDTYQNQEAISNSNISEQVIVSPAIDSFPDFSTFTTNSDNQAESTHAKAINFEEKTTNKPPAKKAKTKKTSQDANWFAVDTMFSFR